MPADNVDRTSATSCSSSARLTTGCSQALRYQISERVPAAHLCEWHTTSPTNPKPLLATLCNMPCFFLLGALAAERLPKGCWSRNWQPRIYQSHWPPKVEECSASQRRRHWRQRTQNAHAIFDGARTAREIEQHQRSYENLSSIALNTSLPTVARRLLISNCARIAKQVRPGSYLPARWRI